MASVENHIGRGYRKGKQDLPNRFHWIQSRWWEAPGQGIIFGTKPVEVLIPYLKVLTKRDDVVIEPFGGSGSTLIAAEKLKRRCFIMENAQPMLKSSSNVGRSSHLVKPRNYEDRRTKEKNSLSKFKNAHHTDCFCEKSGISRATYYRWKKDDPDFREKAEEALMDGESLINDMAESQLISAIRDQNMTAIIFG